MSRSRRERRRQERLPAVTSTLAVAAALLVTVAVALFTVARSGVAVLVIGDGADAPALPTAELAVPFVYVATLLVLVSAALTAAGLLRRRRPESPPAAMARVEPAMDLAGTAPALAGPVLAAPVLAASTFADEAAPTLDELVEAVGGALVSLRTRFGVQFGSRSWVEDVLPLLGQPQDDPVLARDLLASCALGAAGVSADVSALTASHSLERITVVAASLHAALVVLEARLVGGGDMSGLPAHEGVAWG